VKPVSQCFCTNCGQPTSDFDLTITEVGFIMLTVCKRCHFKVESLVHVDILTPMASV